MQFFIDTANLEEIKKYSSLGIIDGVTTNPSLIAKENVSLEKRIKEIVKIIDGPISCEVIATDIKGMLKEAETYSKWHKNIYIKVPMTKEGLEVVNILSKKGIKTNVTLVFQAGQALLAAKAGATLISPFIGRLDDVAEDGMNLIKEIIEMFKNYNFKTKVLVASIRHPRHVIESAKLGADICTIPADVIEKLIHHPLTDIGIQKFLSDYEKVKNLK